MSCANVHVYLYFTDLCMRVICVHSNAYVCEVLCGELTYLVMKFMLKTWIITFISQIKLSGDMSN